MRKAGLFAMLLLLMLVFALPASAQSNPVSITLEREPCFGTCPAYSLTIYVDGTVEYNGLSSVEVTGQQTSQIDKELVAMLVEGFSDAGYFEWQDRYDTMLVTDHPYVTTSVTRNGVTKEIFRYTGDANAPFELAYLETWVDKTVNVEQWTGKQAYVYSAPDQDKNLVIMLDRGQCPETEDAESCPSYLLNIFSDGTVFYVGAKDVAELGVRTTTIDVEDVEALAEELAAGGYFDFAAEYLESDDDPPTVIYSFVSWSENFNAITRYVGDPNTPEALIALEDKIDELVNAVQWVEATEES